MQALPGWTRPIIKVADFGLSKHDASLTFTKVVSYESGGIQVP
jgi:hypothetical protein